MRIQPDTPLWLVRSPRASPGDTAESMLVQTSMAAIANGAPPADVLASCIGIYDDRYEATLAAMEAIVDLAREMDHSRPDPAPDLSKADRVVFFDADGRILLRTALKPRPACDDDLPW